MRFAVTYCDICAGGTVNEAEPVSIFNDDDWFAKPVRIGSAMLWSQSPQLIHAPNIAARLQIVLPNAWRVGRIAGPKKRELLDE